MIARTAGSKPFSSFLPPRNGLRSILWPQITPEAFSMLEGGLLRPHSYHLGNGCQGNSNSFQDSVNGQLLDDGDSLSLRIAPSCRSVTCFIDEKFCRTLFSFPQKPWRLGGPSAYIAFCPRPRSADKCLLRLANSPLCTGIFMLSSSR